MGEFRSISLTVFTVLKVLKQLRMNVNFDFQGINFDSSRDIVNTVKSHCLLDYAKECGKQDSVAEKLFKAYFEEGQNINSVDVLKKVQ